jgi:HAE1 family hydrophobic/amphiphilic exporter-1
MKISQISINRPVGTILVIIAVIALGVISIPNIPVSFWPEFVAPSLIVVAPYPGVGPEEIEEAIGKPLEEELSTIDGIEEIETVCFEGVCRVITRFDWGVKFQDAKRDVQEKTSRARSRFPRMALEPTVLQVQDFIPPGIELGFTSPERGLNEIRDIVDKKVKNQILRLGNVATAQISGGFEEHILVSVKPDMLALYNLSLTQINNPLASTNMDIPAGKLELNRKNYLIWSKGKFVDLNDITSLILTTANGTPVTLGDVADVALMNKERSTITRLNGSEVVGLAVREKSGGNTVAMVDEVLAELENVKKILPTDIKITVIRNQATFIKASIRSVVNNAMIGAVLAGIIILLFLGNIRNTLIIALSIPISIIATFILINQFGLSINTISLGGLALGVGLIVDSSIVVLENIFRHLHEDPGDRKQIVIDAAAEVGTAITSSTLTSVVVFLPMAFLVGLFAVLLGELALTVVFALTLSIIVSLTVVPMLSYKLMRVERGRSIFSRLSGLWQRVFDKLLDTYKPTLRLALRFPALMILLALAVLVLTVTFIAPLLDVEMLPSITQGEFRVDLTLQEATQLSVTDEQILDIEDYLMQQPEIQQVYSAVGKSATLGDVKPNLASVAVTVKPEHVADLDAVMERVRQRWSGIPGARVVIKQSTATEGMEQQPVNVRIIGDDLTVLEDLAEAAIQKLVQIPGIVNLQSTLQENLPEFGIRLNYDKAAHLGIPTPVIASTIGQAVQGLTPTKLSTFGKEYDIAVKIDDTQLTTMEELLALPLSNVQGTMYKLGDVVNVTYEKSPSNIRRYDQQRVVIITADVAGVSQMGVRTAVQTEMAGLTLPPDYYLAFGGQSKGIADSFRSLMIALVIAIFLVYVVMGAQFNSFGQPLIIAITIPLALIGVYAGLLIFGASMSMNALLGMIMLVGIVVNNGILLVDYINQLQQRGVAKMEAIIQAGATRLRPILITSLTTIFGMLPIALAFGEGGEALQPLGAVVAGGLMTSTFLTVLVIPCIYALFTRGPKRLVN